MARILGVGTVVAADRSAARPAGMSDPGCDRTVLLSPDSDSDALAAELQDATGGGADVVADPLWGISLLRH